MEQVTKLEKILGRIGELNAKGYKPVTLFAACPNSVAVVKAAFRAAKRNNAPIIFAATLNQIDCDGGYTGMTQEDFVRTAREEAGRSGYQGDYIIAIDHGGPWLKDIQRIEKWPYEKAMAAVKRSYEAAVTAGYDMIHVDPTVDINVPKGEIIKIEVVAQRTVELISHIEKFRKSKGLPRISYEVGTEEVHGGLADEAVFDRFLHLLKAGLEREGCSDAWPKFIVGKVGTDLHTTFFDSKVARDLADKVRPYGSFIKGHYTDDVSNPEEYPLAGMGAANVGPEFTVCEYDALEELENREKKLYDENRVATLSKMTEVLERLVIDSGRWKKWILPGESSDDFSSIGAERRRWLIRTSARYIWQSPEAMAARWKLYGNMEENGIDAEHIVSSGIEKNMDKYYRAFNLIDLNNYL
ncbi:MAG: class II D-tagatose-bisphosphate aldolase, non-catalytic subunit [Bacteroidales bacterium]|jgi:tagatose-1,6-bisphosphate aldolase non-catalytic subunit AgaZ/GatZ|nr:class II D-tagatose-bisphosphate aldolase, non-catalytic subunit [Bacteroidales bacterium]MCI2121317.1 class II D-tagatose-bisphosphate aldolase, non-catalytic subunit [Bacteroidales bacterium]MCI2145933.1 class II D-tagatose-bisphosphate aldolase, non-catalytic subunit [Bacteroidales bacterium]